MNWSWSWCWFCGNCNMLLRIWIMLCIVRRKWSFRPSILFSIKPCSCNYVVCFEWYWISFHVRDWIIITFFLWDLVVLFLYFWQMTDDICKQVLSLAGDIVVHCYYYLLLTVPTDDCISFLLLLVIFLFVVLSFPSVDFFFWLLQVCIFYLVLRALDTVGMYLFALVLCFLNVLLLIMFERFSLPCACALVLWAKCQHNVCWNFKFGLIRH